MVQEAFVRAWDRRETYADRASLRAWLYKIATNLCIDTLRHKTRRGLPITREPASTLDQPIPASVDEPVWLEPYPAQIFAARIATRKPDIQAVKASGWRFWPRSICCLHSNEPF